MGAPRLAIWTIVLTGLLPGSAVWAQEGTGMVNCGLGVRAMVVDCGKAKRLAREWRKTHAKSLWLYSCAKGEKRVRCVLDRKIITFPAD